MILLIYLAVTKILNNGSLEKASFFIRTFIIVYALRYSFITFPSFKDEVESLKKMPNADFKEKE